MDIFSLQRRELLHALGLAGGASLLGGMPTLAAAAVGAPANTTAGTATSIPVTPAATPPAPTDPLLRPFRAISESTGRLHTPRLATRGRWPAALRGRFHRNGPALYTRGGESHGHWFDGDGMVQQFRIDGGHIAHRGALVETTKLRAEREAGRFLVGSFGTAMAARMPVSGPDHFNTANTNAVEHGGRLLAMWEGGSAHALDPATLDTLGPVVWRPDLAQVPFSAHPKIDPQGHLWNIGTSGPHLLVWHLDPAGRLVQVHAGKSPFPGGMAHDMTVTERHVIVPLPPLKLDFTQPLPEGALRTFALTPGEPLRLLVLEKADLSRQRVFELPPAMVFHVGNAFERGGRIVLDYVSADDAEFLNEGARAPLAGRRPAASRSALQVAELDLGSGRATVRTLGENVEFPRLDPRRIGLPARWLVTVAAQDLRVPFLHQVQLHDTQGGARRTFDYGAHCIAEEHVLVPRPGRSAELDSWLLGTVWDSRRQVSTLNLLDAARIEDGPIAQADLPYVLPLGFHGNFAAV